MTIHAKAALKKAATSLKISQPLNNEMPQPTKRSKHVFNDFSCYSSKSVTNSNNGATAAESAAGARNPVDLEMEALNKMGDFDLSKGYVNNFFDPSVFMQIHQLRFDSQSTHMLQSAAFLQYFMKQQASELSVTAGAFLVTCEAV